MNSAPTHPVSVQDLLTTIQFSDFEVSWAGPALLPDLFGFGSEDGRLCITDTEGASRTEPWKVLTGGEPVNGIAFIDRWMAVSSRDEIMVWRFPLDPGGSLGSARIPVGAHGIIAGISSCFFAPLGLQGLMSCRPQEGEGLSTTIGGNRGAYVYRVASLLDPDGTEIGACALRSMGVGLMTLKGELQDGDLGTVTFPSLDVIDVCPLGSPGRSASLAALGKDGTIILFRDALADKSPLTVKFRSIEGVAYRVLSARGFLFVLTSKALHAIAGLIDQDGTVRQPGPESPVLTIPMEAVDANVAHNRWVLITLSDRVLRLDIEQLMTPRPNGVPPLLQKTAAQRLSPSWTKDTIPQATTSLGSSVLCPSI